MEKKIDEHAVLDYVMFHISSTENRYDSLICSKGRKEALASGLLDQLTFHLADAKKFQSNATNGSFRLELTENLKNSAWFTKSTISRFLLIISVPEVLRNANLILNEMSQLEQSRKFHTALYSKDHEDLHGNGLAGSTKENGTLPTDATKKELLRALDLRLMALKEQMAVGFSAAVSNLSNEGISQLVLFVQYFGTTESRNSLLKHLMLVSEYHMSKKQTEYSQDSNVEDAILLEGCKLEAEIDKLDVHDMVSPERSSQTEHQVRTESDDSFESSDEDQPVVNRSRTLARSASPRRSASPMRRVQIGRSGSRRSTAIAIKSISYFPVREKFSLDNDLDDKHSSTDETSQPPKKPESTVRMMSVKDAISLFESKKNDDDLDLQRKKASGMMKTGKSVLRRWSSGMGDSFTCQSEENKIETTRESIAADVVPKTGQLVEGNVEPDIPQSNVVATTDDVNVCPAQDLVESLCEESTNQAMTSAKWNRQREAELNEMLMNIMEGKSNKFGEGNGKPTCTEVSFEEQKGGFYRKYREKRDAKLRAANVGKQATKDAHFKVLQETLEQNKAMLSSKNGAVKKPNSPVHVQKPRRNSSPPVLPKKDISKTPAVKMASLRQSPAPAMRSSWSSGSLKQSSNSQKSGNAGGISSTCTPTSRQKVQVTTASTQPTPRAQRSIQQTKRATASEGKSITKDKVENAKTQTGSKRSPKTKSLPALEKKLDSNGKVKSYSKSTKKSSVVPLEPKPFLKKGTGTSSGAGQVFSNNRSVPSDDSKDEENPAQCDELEPVIVMAASTENASEADVVLSINDVDAKVETLPENNDLNIENTETLSQHTASPESGLNATMQLVNAEVPPEEEMNISSPAWVQVEHPEVTAESDNGFTVDAVTSGIIPLQSCSPRIRSSLSQMLQADNSEPEILEWGNAENPPALVLQKDSAKGFKRLLKFARKSKGDGSANGWASPSIVSEGENDLEDSEDNHARKTSFHGKGHSKKHGGIRENCDGGSISNRSDGCKMNSGPSAHNENKSRDGQVTIAAKGSRSFFSLSTFRSSKSNDKKSQNA